MKQRDSHRLDKKVSKADWQASREGSKISRQTGIKVDKIANN